MALLLPILRLRYQLLQECAKLLVMDKQMELGVVLMGRRDA